MNLTKQNICKIIEAINLKYEVKIKQKYHIAIPRTIEKLSHFLLQGVVNTIMIEFKTN